LTVTEQRLFVALQAVLFDIGQYGHLTDESLYLANDAIAPILRDACPVMFNASKRMSAHVKADIIIHPERWQ